MRFEAKASNIDCRDCPQGLTQADNPNRPSDRMGVSLSPRTHLRVGPVIAPGQLNETPRCSGTRATKLHRGRPVPCAGQHVFWRAGCLR